ncbi:hypothetical protein Tco_0296133 [Tanacetum coccineum]
MPPTPDLSFIGLDEFVNKPVVENCKAMSSEEEPKVVRKNDDAPCIEEWVSDDEEEDVSQPKIEKKTVRPVPTVKKSCKFDGKADEGFFVGYFLNSKAFRVFNSRTRIVEENLHIRFSESTPNAIEPVKDYILLPLWTADPAYSQDPKSSHDDGSKPLSDDEKKVNVIGGKTSIELLYYQNMPALEDYSIFDFLRDDEDDGSVADMNNLYTKIQVSPIPTTRIHKDHPLDQKKQKGNSCIEGSKLDRGYVRRASIIQATRSLDFNRLPNGKRLLALNRFPGIKRMKGEL